MSDKNQKKDVPNFDNLPMHMPEGNLAVPDAPVEEMRITNGPILILLFVLLLAILGGMYFWFAVIQKQSITLPTNTRPTAEQNNEPESTTAEAQVETMQAVSSSDEVDAIEADLDSTDLNSLDAELQAIDSELDAL